MSAEVLAIKKAVFLAALSKGLTVAEAAQLGGYCRRHFDRLRNDDEEFAADWTTAECVGTDHLLKEIRRRAFEGCRKPIVHQGAIVLHRVYDQRTGFETLEELWLHEYSDTLAMFLLKSRDPLRFDDAVRRAALERQWNKEDGKTDKTLVPAEAVVALIEALEAQKAAKADHAA